MNETPKINIERDYWYNSASEWRELAKEQKEIADQWKALYLQLKARISFPEDD